MVVEDEIDAGRRVRVLPDYDGPFRPVTLLHTADRRPTLKVRSFVDWAVSLLRARP